MGERSIYWRLLKVQRGGAVPLEDYFTEIVAHYLNAHRPTCIAWLNSFNIPQLIPERASEIRVSTQVRVDKLEHQDRDSRLDFCIDLYSEDAWARVVVESKLGSGEHDHQVPRYSELLEAQQGLGVKALVYITRDYEPKTKPGTVAVVFKQRRWRDFYRVLRAQPDAGPCESLRHELLTFMKELNMADRNQFEAVDLLTLSSLNSVVDLMNLTLGDDVRAKFKRVLGTVSDLDQTYAQIRHKRFVIFHYCKRGERRGECLLGYWPIAWEGAPFPVVGVHLNLWGGRPDRLKHGKVYEAIAKARGWRSYNLGKESEYGGIAREKSLAGFLEEPDHVRAIRKYLSEALDEVAQIKEEYPELPW